MVTEFKINNRYVGHEHEPLIIAEIGINHGGSLDLAIEMVDSAIYNGAEVIKHQTHIIEDEMSDEAKLIIPDNADKSIYEIMLECALSEEEELRLMQHVIAKKSIFISTPFSRAAVDRLSKFDIPCFKIGSGECNNYPLIKYICSFGKPIIVSTGMNSLDNILKTVQIIEANNIPYALLHCTNVYPTPPNLVRLDAIKILQDKFPNAVIGLSDHTINNYTCLGGIALGCSIIEKHFTDHKKRLGPDIVCSMDGNDLKDLIIGSQTLFAARGSHKGPIFEEKKTIEFAFASVVAIRDIEVNEELTDENIWVRRPGNGDFNSEDYENLLGKKVLNKVTNGTQLKKIDVDKY